jgi:hypothetical protein
MDKRVHNYLEGSKASSARPSDKGRMEVKMLEWLEQAA